MTLWTDALSDNPMIAILRGLEPDRAVETATILVEEGFRIIEVPLNSPDPLTSIRAISEAFGDRIVTGAGTVLCPEDVRAVKAAGGSLIVSPNVDEAVGAAAKTSGMIWAPGVFSPTEAFRALQLGADLLKFFPAEVLGPAGIKALRAVLPADARIAAVGGVTPVTLADFKLAGADGFGLGSGLFKPELTGAEVALRAKGFLSALRAI